MIAVLEITANLCIASVEGKKRHGDKKESSYDYSPSRKRSEFRVEAKAQLAN